MSSAEHEELRRRLAALAEDLAGDATPLLDRSARARVLDAVSRCGPAFVAGGIDDEELRDRLVDLADEAGGELEPAARQRILERVERDGPSHWRNRRWRRAAGWGLPAAVAASLALWFAIPRETRLRESEAIRACETWTRATARPLDGREDLSGRLERMDLGRRGSAMAAGDVSLRSLDGCTTELWLAAGRVEVHAADLGGGTLRVRAGPVTVEVRGTRFSVRRDGEQVEVDVQAGHVVVRVPDEREIHLRAGESWVRGVPRGAGAASAPAGPESESEVGLEAGTAVRSGVEHRSESDALARSAESEPGRAPGGGAGAAAPTRGGVRTERSAERGEMQREVERDHAEEARALLAEAETRWRDGERGEARALFRRVGMGRGSLAELSWIRLARLELRNGDVARAVEAVRAQRQRFPRSRFGAEALWIEADARRRQGNVTAMHAVIERLRAQYPESPQARSAASFEP